MGRRSRQCLPKDHGSTRARPAPSACPSQNKERGAVMRSLASLAAHVLLSALALCFFAAASADAATISGAVTGPDGKPFRAAFVQARNAKMKMTVSVLSDSQGR